MSKFAKLIELENDEQVLLTVNYNDSDDTHEVFIRTDLEGCTTQIKLAFDDEEDAIKMLNSYSNEDAIKHRAGMEAMMS
jgi:hypothetical protein